MEMVWLSVLICSLALLVIIASRSGLKIRWIGYSLVNLLFAAVVLYFINAVGGFGSLTIPINVVTVAVVGILGIPGIALLAALKWVLL